MNKHTRQLVETALKVIRKEQTPKGGYELSLRLSEAVDCLVEALRMINGYCPDCDEPSADIDPDTGLCPECLEEANKESGRLEYLL